MVWIDFGGFVFGCDWGWYGSLFRCCVCLCLLFVDGIWNCGDFFDCLNVVVYVGWLFGN